MSNLYILTTAEQQAFDYPPILSVETRALCFAIDHGLEKEINRLKTSMNKVGFLLQYGYFKACKRFFFMNRFKQEDVEYSAKLLGITIDDIDLSCYKKRMPVEHQKKILALFDCRPFNDEVYAWLKKEAIQQVERQIEPKQIFTHLLNLLIQNKCEIPSYHSLAELITHVYFEFERGLLNIINKKLRENDKKLLDALLNEDNQNYSTLLNQLKTISQSTKPKAIQASLALFNTVKDYFLRLKPVIDSLELSPNGSAYYATWMQKAKLSQLKQFPEKEKLYLHMVAFIQHQFYLRQDYFIDIFLKSVQSIRNTATKKIKEADHLSRTERRNAVRYLTKSNHYYKNLIDEISKVTKSPVLTDAGKIRKIDDLIREYAKQKDDTEHQKIELFAQSLERLEKNKDYFDILEKLSIKLQRRITDIFKGLIFNESSSDTNLICSINHIKNNDEKVKNNAPIGFLESEEREVLFDENKKIRTSLYKILLFLHVFDAIKSGELNLKHSYRYKAIDEYLIDKNIWQKNRDQIIKSAQLEKFSNYIHIMEKLKQYLEEKYTIVNHRFIEGRNPYLSINEKNRILIKTPALGDKDTEYIAALLEQAGYVPILQILSDIENTAQLTKCFKHYSIKHVKQRPSSETFFAGIIGLGCNIGIMKMAQISVGIRENTLLNTVSWYFSLKNLHSVNQKIVDLMSKLTLSNIFIEDKKETHSSSDGRKVNVGVDSLIASYSFKYHGNNKGVSVYTFIDERQALFHSLVMSSAEREAAYVIDGLLQNDVVKTSIHSTDTHGFTESVFATAHFLDIAFAPRIKKIGKQRIYAFSSPETYVKRGYKILPSRIINQKLIAKHWDDILRFMATIKLKQVTASQLFKRLSSYAKDHPLYQALKEFGRIIKSIFILTYFDDVKLRQRIEKQLNRIELSNKFSNAVFFANDSEFKQGTREEQEIATACKVLIQNAVVLWNYLYLS